MCLSFDLPNGVSIYVCWSPVVDKLEPFDLICLPTLSAVYSYLRTHNLKAGNRLEVTCMIDLDRPTTWRGMFT